MSSSTASDKEWSLSLDNCIIDDSGSDTRSLVVCYGYRKQLRIRNCTFIGSATATDNVSIHAGQPLLDCGGVENVSEQSEAHTSELQSLMRLSYAVFCLKKTKMIRV